MKSIMKSFELTGKQSRIISIFVFIFMLFPLQMRADWSAAEWQKLVTILKTADPTDPTVTIRYPEINYSGIDDGIYNVEIYWSTRTSDAVFSKQFPDPSATTTGNYTSGGYTTSSEKNGDIQWRTVTIGLPPTIYNFADLRLSLRADLKIDRTSSTVYDSFSASMSKQWSKDELWSGDLRFPNITFDMQGYASTGVYGTFKFYLRSDISGTTNGWSPRGHFTIDDLQLNGGYTDRMYAFNSSGTTSAYYFATVNVNLFTDRPVKTWASLYRQHYVNGELHDIEIFGGNTTNQYINYREVSNLSVSKISNGFSLSWTLQKNGIAGKTYIFRKDVNTNELKQIAVLGDVTSYTDTSINPSDFNGYYYVTYIPFSDGTKDMTASANSEYLNTTLLPNPYTAKSGLFGTCNCEVNGTGYFSVAEAVAANSGTFTVKINRLTAFANDVTIPTGKTVTLKSDIPIVTDKRFDVIGTLVLSGVDFKGTNSNGTITTSFGTVRTENRTILRNYNNTLITASGGTLEITYSRLLATNSNSGNCVVKTTTSSSKLVLSNCVMDGNSGYIVNSTCDISSLTDGSNHLHAANGTHMETTKTISTASYTVGKSSCIKDNIHYGADITALLDKGTNVFDGYGLTNANVPLVYLPDNSDVYDLTVPSGSFFFTTAGYNCTKPLGKIADAALLNNTKLKRIHIDNSSMIFNSPNGNANWLKDKELVVPYDTRADYSGFSSVFGNVVGVYYVENYGDYKFEMRPEYGTAIITGFGKHRETTASATVTCNGITLPVESVRSEAFFTDGPYYLGTNIKFIEKEAYPTTAYLNMHSIPEIEGYSQSPVYNLNFELNDDSYLFLSDTEYNIYNNCSYTRHITEPWNTVVLPFDMALSGSENFVVSPITTVDGNIGFKPCSVSNISRNTPAFLHVEPAVIGSDITLTASGKTLKLGSGTLNNNSCRWFYDYKKESVSVDQLGGMYAVFQGNNVVWEKSKALNKLPFYAYILTNADITLVLPQKYDVNYDQKFSIADIVYFLNLNNGSSYDFKREGFNINGEPYHDIYHNSDIDGDGDIDLDDFHLLENRILGK